MFLDNRKDQGHSEKITNWNAGSPRMKGRRSLGLPLEDQITWEIKEGPEISEEISRYVALS
jgi:hypothetical protein